MLQVEVGSIILAVIMLPTKLGLSVVIWVYVILPRVCVRANLDSPEKLVSTCSAEEAKLLSVVVMVFV